MVFAIRKYLPIKEKRSYLEDLLFWLNSSLQDTEKFSLPENDYQWNLLSETLLQKLEEYSEYLESNPFDQAEPRASQNSNLSILLDNLRAPYNVGSILRSAEAFHADKVLLCGITPGRENAKVIRTSMNASIPTIRYKNSIEAICAYQKEGYAVIAIEKTSRSNNLTQFSLPKTTTKHLIVFGNEEFGLSDELLCLADFTLHIPLFGRKNSLNVSVAAGIALYQLTKTCNK